MNKENGMSMRKFVSYLEKKSDSELYSYLKDTSQLWDLSLPKILALLREVVLRQQERAVSNHKEIK